MRVLTEERKSNLDRAGEWESARVGARVGRVSTSQVKEDK